VDKHPCSRRVLRLRGNHPELTRSGPQGYGHGEWGFRAPVRGDPAAVLDSLFMEPDILYAVRSGERNEPLKLSLRSLAHVPHHRVFIAGYCPQWVTGVTRVEVRRRVNKFDAIEENVRQGLQHPEMGHDVIYMNDDFYITRPIESIPPTHGGPIDQYSGKQHELRIRMRRTLGSLRDRLHEDVTLFAYDGVHTPLPLVRWEALRHLESCPRGGLWRTWYGNLAAIGGERVSDAKARGPLGNELPTLVSTGPKGLQALRGILNDMIPQESPYVQA
jgi:hypothetical protein